MIKFVSYDGKYPNLCRGTLTIEKDGERYELRNVLQSGGRNFYEHYGDGYVEMGPWIVDPRELPEELVDSVEEIEELVNEHVDYGCCGGYQ
jgi:hypothetical protein